MAQSYDNCVEEIVLNWIKQILQNMAWVSMADISIMKQTSQCMKENIDTESKKEKH